VTKYDVYILWLTVLGYELFEYLSVVNCTNITLHCLNQGPVGSKTLL